MNRKRTALSVAVVGTTTGMVGLVLLATPAGAGQAPPALPDVLAESLVQSVLSTEVPALAGKVELQSELGLPIPGLPQGAGNGELARVYSDGEGRGRIALGKGPGERTFVQDGKTLWIWDSKDRSVVKVNDIDKQQKTAEKLADPATAARELVRAMQQDSTVTVDGTARVADRPAYQLVLTPKPTERTLLREVRVAIDSETRLPLRLEVMANGQPAPALRIGFTEFSTGAQDPALFTYTPPAGVKVTEPKPDEAPTREEQEDFLAKANLKPVGQGWDIVLTGKIPADALAKGQSAENGPDRRSGADANPMGLLKQFGTEVSGPFGTGYVISTKVGTALVTTDGRVAVGAVPQQVLVDALGAK
ncbi:MAG: outer membrane lipoprotein carrier protein LolA [Actinomycetota bacterium]|nr:outer membrane lipoprotein carrier protein LolA [Actinomycetota bacterium]